MRSELLVMIWPFERNRSTVTQFEASVGFCTASALYCEPVAAKLTYACVYLCAPKIGSVWFNKARELELAKAETDGTNEEPESGDEGDLLDE